MFVAPDPDAPTVGPHLGEPAGAMGGTRSTGATTAPGGVLKPPDEGFRDLNGPLLPGQNFGDRYHILRLLGLGGMGAVYQAWDNELGVTVAVKVIRPAGGTDPREAKMLERRFKQELLLARQVTHRNVVRIHDLGEIHGVKYITMPYVEGEDLSTVLRREDRLPIRRALQLARSMVSGLAAAHAAGVIHRDLKPANIMINADGEPLIMDFGIARSMTDAIAPAAGPPPAAHARGGAVEHTSLGVVVGTVEYMAPEQARAGRIDHRVDIYAFGLILYDLLLGRRRVMQPGDALVDLEKRMQAAPPAPHSVEPQIPEALSRIISRCLQPDVDARYATTADVAAEIERLDADGHPLPMVRRLTRRMAAASVSVIIGLLVLTWWLASGPATPVARDPVSVLIADFNNVPQDKTLEGTLESALGIALEGAPFITSYSRTGARQIASGLTTRPVIDEYAARLIAVREGITVILVGTVHADDRGGYRIIVKGQNANGTELWTHQSVARTRANLLVAVDAVASDIRSALGDTASTQNRFTDSESVTTNSLEAFQSYTTAQELYSIGKFDDAVKQFEASTAQDPTFGRAYAGLANALFYMGRKAQAEENWNKALSLMDRMTEREKYRTQGTYFFGVARNYEKAIDNYETLVKLYPSDSSGLNNLAMAYFMVLNFPKALEAGRRVLALYPKNVLFRNNYALYAMYAGDFATAVRESEPLLREPGQNPFFKIYLPPAIAAAVNGQSDAATEAYRMMAKAGPEGASLADTGLADFAMYRGRYDEAESILHKGIEADAKSRNAAGLTAKRMMLAEVYAATGRTPLALTMVAETLKLGSAESVLVPAARLYLNAERLNEAKALAARLADQLQTQSRAYARIIDGRIAMLSNRRGSAIDAYREAVKLTDLWLARYEMGIAYAETGAWIEALSELAACEKRRGEAIALFLDDVPTVRYLATLPYWLARSQEGLGQQAAARANYERFLSVRGANRPTDALVIDARRRAGS